MRIDGTAGWWRRPMTAREISLFADDFPTLDLSRVRLIGGGVPRGFDGMTVGYWIFLTKRFDRLDPWSRYALLAHELVHVQQYRDAAAATGAGLLGFLLPYLLDYFRKRSSGMSRRDAYASNPSEREARYLTARIMAAKSPHQLAECGAEIGPVACHAYAWRDGADDG